MTEAGIIARCKGVLEAFAIDTEDLQVRTGFWQPMPHNYVYRCSVDKTEYAIFEDDSAGDDVRFVVDNLAKTDDRLRGQLLPNPVKQADGAIFAAGFDGHEYYLWRLF